MKHLRPPSPGVVLAIVAIALSGAGSAVAASQITSRQIKNHTIRLRDINPATLRQLAHGGPQGPPGPQGAQGQPGPPGQAGPLDVTYLRRKFSVPGNGVSLRELACPAGQVPVSGGTFSPPENVALSTPGRDGGDAGNAPDGWSVLFRNPGEKRSVMEIYVVCTSATSATSKL